MKPRTGRMGADVIIDEAGQVWVSEADIKTWPRNYIKIEELRAEDHDCSRGARPNSGSRSGRPSQWGFDPGAERGNDYAQGFEFDQKSDPIAEGVAAHERLEDLFNPAGYKFLRDDYALTPEMLDQIRLYAMQYSGRDDGIRHWPV